MQIMNEYICTDLATECRDVSHPEGLQGITYSESVKNGITVSRIEIQSDDAQRTLGKPKGTYVTLAFGAPWLMDEEQRGCLCETLSSQLADMIFKMAPDAKTALVAGLGNRRITADAVGPETVDRITVTNHLQTLAPSVFLQVGQLAVAALVPGVLGDTGIEAAELVAKAAQAVKPDIIIAVDALAARNVDRLGCTVQLSDCGVAPGSGVGNKRMALTRDTLGVPVLALGVPTVVNSATLVRDALGKAGIHDISPALKEVLDNGKSFFVTPKESDAALDSFSKILSTALDMALTAQKEA